MNRGRRSAQEVALAEPHVEGEQGRELGFGLDPFGDHIAIRGAGEVVEIDGDCYGDAVNSAARLASTSTWCRSSATCWRPVLI